MNSKAWPKHRLFEVRRSQFSVLTKACTVRAMNKCVSRTAFPILFNNIITSAPPVVYTNELLNLGDAAYLLCEFFFSVVFTEFLSQMIFRRQKAAQTAPSASLVRVIHPVLCAQAGPGNATALKSLVAWPACLITRLASALCSPRVLSSPLWRRRPPWSVTQQPGPRACGSSKELATRKPELVKSPVLNLATLRVRHKTSPLRSKGGEEETQA